MRDTLPQNVCLHPGGTRGIYRPNWYSKNQYFTKPLS